MQKVFALLSLACTHILATHAQYCIESRFTQAEYFADDEIIIQNGVSYGLADDWYAGVPQPVLNSFNIAFPDPAIDPLETRPLVVLAHGGGFWGGTKEDLDYHIQRLAKSGYVAVTMNYRKGWDGNPDNCLGDPLSLAGAIYKAMQDTRACMRYLAANAGSFGIDTAWIFMGGESAGSYAVMNSVYLSQDEWNSVHPGFEEIYDGLDGSTNDIEINYSVKGFINMWGGVLDTTLVSSEELKPTISFYGTSDDVIPPDAGHIQFCDAFEHVNGSLSLSSYLGEKGICNQLHEHFMYGHEAYEDDYTTGNMACFMKGLFCNDCSTRVVQYEEANCSDMVAGIHEIENNSVTVYPNPSNSFVTLQLQSDMFSDVIITISDMTGKISQPAYSVSQNMATLNISNLASGIYMVSVQNGGKYFTGKIIVSK